MSLEQTIKNDMKQAMKEGQAGKQKLGVIRMLLSDISNKKIDLKKQDQELTDDEVRAVIKSFVKKIDQEIEGFQSGGRDTSSQEAQKDILATYLPQLLSQEQIEAAVENAIKSTGAVSIKEMGKVMGALKSIGQQADMKVVNELVRRKLS